MGGAETRRRATRPLVFRRVAEGTLAIPVGRKDRSPLILPLILRKDEEPQAKWAHSGALAGFSGDCDGVKQRHDKARDAVHWNEIVGFTDSGGRERIRSFETCVNAISGESL